jgi:hypothetical protein
MPDPRSFGRIAPVTVLTVKQWATKATVEHSIGLQKQIVTFLVRAYGSLLAASVSIFLLQGFGIGGFKLSETVLRYVGAATIGEIGGLLALTFRAAFMKKG